MLKNNFNKNQAIYSVNISTPYAIIDFLSTSNNNSTSYNNWRDPAQISAPFGRRSRLVKGLFTHHCGSYGVRWENLLILTQLQPRPDVSRSKRAPQLFPQHTLNSTRRPRAERVRLKSLDSPLPSSLTAAPLMNGYESFSHFAPTRPWYTTRSRV